MNCKQKTWVWVLTWPFAHNNWTLVGPNTLYCPKGRETSEGLLRHEEIHAKQMKEEGVVKYYFCYLFLLPFFFNPWRKKWEWEAYRDGSKWSEDQIKARLNTAMYGWI